MDFEPLEKFMCVCAVVFVIIVFGAGVVVSEFLFPAIMEGCGG